MVLRLVSGLLVIGLGIGSAAAWAVDGPAEILAIVRLDRMHAIPWTPLGIRTCYSPGFTHAGFLAIRQGESMESVRLRLGPPLQVVWVDEAKGRRTIEFELRRGHYVVSATYGVEIARGTSMESLASLRREFQETQWDYSRQCTPIDSNRTRKVGFEAGRVTWRLAGLYYD